MFVSGAPLGGWSLRKLGLAISVATLVVSTGALPEVARARGSAPHIEAVELAELPQEAKATHDRIRSGGPFPYSKDGSVFANRERLLPASTRGYYREYTVRTFGARDRGARRIVCGGHRPREPETCYYTDDHYASYRRIVP